MTGFHGADVLITMTFGLEENTWQKVNKVGHGQDRGAIANDFSVGHLGVERTCLPMKEKARPSCRRQLLKDMWAEKPKQPQWALSSVKHEWIARRMKMIRRQQVLNQARETKSQEDSLEAIYIRSLTQNCENYKLRCPGTKTPNNWGAKQILKNKTQKGSTFW